MSLMPCNSSWAATSTDHWGVPPGSGRARVLGGSSCGAKASSSKRKAETGAPSSVDLDNMRVNVRAQAGTDSPGGADAFARTSADEIGGSTPGDSLRFARKSW